MQDINIPSSKGRTDYKLREIDTSNFDDSLFKELPQNPKQEDFYSVLRKHGLQGVPFGTYARYLQWLISGKSHGLIDERIEENTKSKRFKEYQKRVDAFAENFTERNRIYSKYQNLAATINIPLNEIPDDFAEVEKLLQVYTDKLLPNLKKLKEFILKQKSELKTQKLTPKEKEAKKQQCENAEKVYNRYKNRFDSLLDLNPELKRADINNLAEYIRLKTSALDNELAMFLNQQHGERILNAEKNTLIPPYDVLKEKIKNLKETISGIRYEVQKLKLKRRISLIMKKKLLKEKREEIRTLSKQLKNSRELMKYYKK